MSVTINKKCKSDKNNKQVSMQPPGLPMPKKSKGTEVFAGTVHMIQNLTKEQVLEHAKLASDMRGYGAFYFGGALSVIHCNGWCNFYGYKNIAELASDKFGISKSTTYDYMAIYDNLVESGVVWENIEHLGWTKIRLIARYLTQKNLNKWVEIANSKNAMELREFVRQSVSKKQDLIVSESPKLSTHVENDIQTTDLVSTELAESIPKKIIYNLFPEQVKIVEAAIKLAMDESETSHINVALENICMNYLSSH